jgi:metal-responsive CopG/Arc/MetJ family transcriptional regulator
MAEQAPARPEPTDYRVTVPLRLPLSLVRRLEPHTSRRNRSRFIVQAIEAALGQAEQDQDRAHEPV